MNIYSVFSVILMALLLFYSQLKTVYARFPFGIQSIVNEDPEKLSGHDQYDNDLKWDMGMMPRAHFGEINRAPERDIITDEYRVSKGYHQIIGGPEEFDRDEYNIDRIMPRAYDFKNSETDNLYFHENYGSNGRDKVMQRMYHGAVGRELEDLANENYNDEDNVGQSSPNYDENSETENEDNVDISARRTHVSREMPGNKGKSYENYDVDMSSNWRRNFDTMNREPENDDNNYENSDSEYEDNEDWSTTNYDETSDDEKEYNTPRLEEPKTIAVVEAVDDDYGVDMGELSSPRRGGPKTSPDCSNNGGECKAKCHESLRYGNRGCGRGQFCCLVAYRVVALY